MSAGRVKAPQATRCGCCDTPTTFALCGRCDEPMCPSHFVRVRDDEGAVSYVCTICAEAMVSAGNAHDCAVPA